MKRCLIALTVLLAACSGANTDKEDGIQSYELMTIERREYTVDVEYAAQIRGLQDTRIVPRVDGYLQRVCVKEGEEVKRGQLLFVIDQVQYRAAVKAAQAAVLQVEAMEAKAQQELEGKRMLKERNVISDFELNQAQRDLEVARANVAAAKAELENANNNLSFTELRSPTDGVIGRIPYREGDFVGPTTTEGLTVVSNNSMMCAYFSMTESKVMEYLSEHTSMHEAVASMPALTLVLPTGQRYGETGRVESVSGVVDDKTGAVSVRALFPNANGLLLSGGTARVVMPQNYKAAVVIPQEATYEIQDKVYVFKVIDGRTSSTIVSVERLNDGKSFVVTNGLDEGDVIVAKGAGLVHEGTRVKEVRK